MSVRCASFARSRRKGTRGKGQEMSEISDEIRERIAIEVEHMPPDEAQAEYDRRIAEKRTGDVNDATDNV